MCSPAAAMGAMAAGTAMNAYGAYQSQRAQNRAAAQQARIHELNAMVARKQAQEIERTGFLSESRHRGKVSAFAGSQRVGFAGAGVDVLSGTPLDVYHETETLGDLDALEIRYQAAVDAWAMRRQAESFQMQAAMARSTRASPWMAAAGPLLGGLGQMGMSYASWSAAQRG